MKYLKIVVLMLVANTCMGQDKPVIDTGYANGYYVARLAFFNKMPNHKKEIVFLGNSITEAGEWQELTGMKNVINRGISGDNSFGVFHRLDEVLSAKPAKIFLMIGVNDLKRGTPEDVIVHNYERIVAMVKQQSPATALYLQSVLPVNEAMLANIYAKINNEKIRSLNKKLKAVAERNKVTFVDLNGQVFADPQGQMPKSLSTDGLHLQPLAYIEWLNYLKTNKYL